jgi:hypothetical protein
MNYTGFAAVLFGVPVFFAVESRLRKATPSTRWPWLSLLTLLSIPSILFAVDYLHVLPESEWFYALRSCQGSEFLALFPAAAAGTLASAWPRLSVALPLFGFLVLASAPYSKPVFNPLDESAFTERWQGDACLQSTGATCGPACVATLLKRAGVSTTERAVARACHTSASGTEAWYLARYVRAAPSEHGILAGFSIRPGFSPERGLPAMIGIRLRGGGGHFLAVLENKEGIITFVDPLFGQERLPLEDFRKRFTFTGFHMCVIND